MTVGWPVNVDPDNLGTVTCLEYAVYRYRIKVQCLADRFADPPDEDLKPLADLAAQQITGAWKALAAMARLIEERRGSN